ncbi:hypothetical protein HRbin15_01502 [bacterium HR15]|nr:hypothetical protein HRbin15_01502 [bacterium HR15]
MRESSYWFGILRSLLAPETVWLLWWGLWVIGVVNIWWGIISKLLLYAWFILIVIIGLIYSISWNKRNFYITILINLSTMLFSIYFLQLCYYTSVPTISSMEEVISFSVSIASPVFILIGYLWRLSQVLKNERD